MGEKPDILLTENGKWSQHRIECTFKLLKNTQPNLIDKARKLLPKKHSQEISKSKWKKKMGTTKNDQKASKLFNELLEWDAFEKTGMESNGNRYNPVYSLNRSQLLKAVSESIVFETMLPGFEDTINNEVDSKTVDNIIA